LAKDLGPYMGGRLTGVVPDDKDPDKLVICSPGGGVWTTVDNGKNWKLLWKGLNDPSIFHIEWDIYNTNRLYAISPSTLFACDNPFGAEPTWIELAGGTANGQVPMPPNRGHTFDNPVAFQQLDFGNNKRAIIWARTGDGLYYSFDGKTFKTHAPVTNKTDKPEAYIVSIGADGNNVVYFGTQMSLQQSPSIYRSTAAWKDGKPTLTWEKINKGIELGNQIIDFEWLADAKKLAVLTSDGSALVYLMSPGGSEWAKTQTPVPQRSWSTSCITDLGGNSFIIGTLLPYVTHDLGKTWKDLWKNYDHADTRAITVKHFPALKKTYAWRTTDGFDNQTQPYGTRGNIVRWELKADTTGTNFQYIPVVGVGALQSQNGLMVVTSSGKKRYVTGSYDNGSVIMDEGSDWTLKGAPGGTGCGDDWSIVAAPSDPNRVYVRTCDRSFVTTDNFQSAKTPTDIKWKVLNGNYALNLAPPSRLSNGMTSVHPKNKDEVYFACLFDVARSSDGGKSFTLTRLPSEPQLMCVHTTEKELLAGTIDKGIYISTDKGKTWKEFGLNKEGIRYVGNITKSMYKGGTYYAATSNGLYRKYPKENWKLVTVKGRPVTDVVFRPGCEQYVWVASGYNPNGSHKGELMLSNNYGDTWRTIYDEGVPITDLSLTMGKTPYLIIASYGRGLQSIELAETCK